MMLYQIFDCVFATLSCVLLFGYSGAVTNLVALVRNVVEYFNIKSNILTVALILALIGISMYDYISTHNILVILPAVAFIEYTVVLSKSNDFKICKKALFVNEVMWLLYEIIIMNYAGALVTVVLAISTLNAIKHTKDAVADNGLTKYQRKQFKFEIDRLKRQS